MTKISTCSRTSILSCILLCLAVILLVASCSVRRSTPIKGPVPLEDSHVRNGQIQFMAHCQKCHPAGESGLGLAINTNPAPKFIKRFQVRHGLGVMPSFGVEEISDEDLSDILSYLRALRKN